MKHTDSLSKRLQQEMKDVVFSDIQRAELATRLSRKLVESNSATFTQRIAAIWNGYTEIPLTAGVVGVGVISFILISAVTNLLVIDQSTALLLLQSSQGMTDLRQGVSLL